MSTEDGASTKRQKAHAMLGQLREGNGVDGGEGGGTEGWEEVRINGVPRLALEECPRFFSIGLNIRRGTRLGLSRF